MVLQHVQGERKDRPKFVEIAQETKSWDIETDVVTAINAVVTEVITLIDHFSTNKPRYILSSGVIKSGMVDHFMIYAIRKVNAWRIRSKKSKVLETRSLRNYDKAKFLNDIKEVN